MEFWNLSACWFLSACPTNITQTRISCGKHHLISMQERLGGEGQDHSAFCSVLVRGIKDQKLQSQLLCSCELQENTEHVSVGLRCQHFLSFLSFFFIPHAHIHVSGEGLVVFSPFIIHEGFEPYRLILMRNRKSPQIANKLLNKLLYCEAENR